MGCSQDTDRNCHQPVLNGDFRCPGGYGLSVLGFDRSPNHESRYLIRAVKLTPRSTDGGATAATNPAPPHRDQPLIIPATRQSTKLTMPSRHTTASTPSHQRSTLVPPGASSLASTTDPTQLLHDTLCNTRSMHEGKVIRTGRPSLSSLAVDVMIFVTQRFWLFSRLRGDRG
jgi:hypothetical protein